MDTDPLSDDAPLDDVPRETFGYFLHEANDRNGLVADCTRPGWPCSIAATGLALASYPVGVERGWMARRGLDDRLDVPRRRRSARSAVFRPAWMSTYDWRTLYGYEHVYAGPLFIHQLSHAWIDFRDIRDEYMRAKGIDYFENSRRATRMQHRYAIDNPNRFGYYNTDCWGITAGDGPGPADFEVHGVRRRSWGMRHAARRSGPTTARSRRGLSSHRCRSPRPS